MKYYSKHRHKDVIRIHAKALPEAAVTATKIHQNGLNGHNGLHVLERVVSADRNGQESASGLRTPAWGSAINPRIPAIPGIPRISGIGLGFGINVQNL